MALQRGRNESWKRRLRQGLQSKAVLLRWADEVWWSPWPFEKQLKVNSLLLAQGSGLKQAQAVKSAIQKLGCSLKLCVVRMSCTCT